MSAKKEKEGNKRKKGKEMIGRGGGRKTSRI
jgi:hypothetical protein